MTENEQKLINAALDRIEQKLDALAATMRWTERLEEWERQRPRIAALSSRSRRNIAKRAVRSVLRPRQKKRWWR